MMIKGLFCCWVVVVFFAAAVLPVVGYGAGGEAKTYVLKGKIVDVMEAPLADVRVGLRNAGVAARTDGMGEFALTLTVGAGQELKLDNRKVYDDLEIDKEGFMGKAVEIRDLAFFDAPLREKLGPYPVTEDRAEFTTRMSLEYVLPAIGTNKEFDLITPEAWGKWLAGMDGRKVGAGASAAMAKTEQVVFQAYVPKGVAKVKAVFLLTRHGIGSIDHARLRAFADRNGVALVSAKGNPVQRGFYPVSLLDEPIARLGRMLKHSELGQAPVIVFGHSNGTGFSGIIASQRPDRVIGWISYHSGAAFHLQFPGVERVPGLVLHGMIDPFFKNGQVETVRHLRAERNAALAMMIEANVAHAPVDKDQNATWDFIAAFAEAAMRVRLNEDGSLKPVVLEQGWLGASYDTAKGGQQELGIAPYGEFKAGDKSGANWLPDEAFAKVWQAYGKTDPRPVAGRK